MECSPTLCVCVHTLRFSMYSSVGNIISVLCSIVTQKKSVIRPTCVCVCVQPQCFLTCSAFMFSYYQFSISYLSLQQLSFPPPPLSLALAKPAGVDEALAVEREWLCVCVLLTELRDLIDTHRENYTSFQMLSLCLFNILLHLCAWVCPNSHPWPQCTGALGWVEAFPSLCFIDRSHLCFFSPPLLQHSHFFRSFLPSFILIHAWFSCLLSLSSSSFVTYNKLL